MNLMKGMYIDSYLPGFEYLEKIEMDKKIKKIIKSEKKSLKDTKQLLKMDKKQDKKLAKC